MRWKVVLVAGLAVSAALLAAAKATMPPHGDSVIPALPLYLAWAGVGMVGITLALAWLVVVDTPLEVGRAVVILASAVTLVAVGQGAIYVDRHPSQERICVPSGCGAQPNRPAAERNAAEVFLVGTAVVAVMGSAAFAALRHMRAATAA